MTGIGDQESCGRTDVRQTDRLTHVFFFLFLFFKSFLDILGEIYKTDSGLIPTQWFFFRHLQEVLFPWKGSYKE